MDNVLFMYVLNFCSIFPVISVVFFNKHWIKKNYDYGPAKQDTALFVFLYFLVP